MCSKILKRTLYSPGQAARAAGVLRLPGFLDNWHMRVVGLSALSIGHLYPQKIPLVLISVKRLSRLQGHIASGRIMSMKNLHVSTNYNISYPKFCVRLIFIGL